MSKVAEDVVLKVPDFGKEFVLETDASNVAVGATLNQKDNEGRLRPVTFLSRSLTAAERNYTTTERELLTVVWSIGRLRKYLLHMPFEVVVDHANLQWLVSRPRAGRVGRWVMALAEYDFSIKFKPGNKHVVPDALSRVEFPTSFQEWLRDEELGRIPSTVWRPRWRRRTLRRQRWRVHLRRHQPGVE